MASENTRAITISMDRAIGVNLVKDLEYDVEGYCRVVLSVLDIPNSVGLTYDSKPFIHVINTSKYFRQALEDGQLYGENGHPVKEPGMSRTDFFNRAQIVLEKRTCFHIRDVEIDHFNDVASGERQLGVFGWIKPTGELAHVLREALSNPNENVAFSLRGVAPLNPRTGKKELRSLATWDRVNVPGLRGSAIANAKGNRKTAMESYEMVIEITDDEIEAVCADMESGDATAFREAMRLFPTAGSSSITAQKPNYL